MKIRNRIKSLRTVRAGDLVPNPRNWRTHPQGQQDALRGVLAEIGYADALIARELPDGRLMLIDGHLRAETTPDVKVPVLVTDLTEEEADKLLATLDPLAAMAEADEAKLADLLATIETESEGLQAMLDNLHGSNESNATPLAINPTKPPRMAWVLVGIPLVQFGDIAADIEKLSAIPGAIIETTANDANG